MTPLRNGVQRHWPRTVLKKAQKWVFQALLLVRSWLPFALLGLHTDCGGEFINDHLVRYCCYCVASPRAG